MSIEREMVLEAYKSLRFELENTLKDFPVGVTYNVYSWGLKVAINILNRRIKELQG